MSHIVIRYLEYGILATATILLCALATHWILEDRNTRRPHSRHQTSGSTPDERQANRAAARDRSA